MRIRSIKPEFWRSESVNRLSREVRLLFIGLWSYVDDNGVGINDYRQIAADLFPLDDDPTEVREFVREGLARLSREGRITCYHVSGKPYLYITGWEHQRIDKPGKPRYPKPDADGATPLASENADVRETLATSSRECRESLAPGTGEQGNRGTVLERTPSSLAHLPASDVQPGTPEPAKRPKGETYTAEFEAWWAHYPRKADKFKASKAFTTARKAWPLAMITDGVKRYAVEVQGKEADHIKHGATWLTNRCWENYTPVAPGDARETARTWLLGEYDAARVMPIQQKTGLRYAPPDLPLDVSGKEAAERFHLDAVRTWIKTNHDVIIDRLTMRAAQ